jgi:hypothetical protein
MTVKDLIISLLEYPLDKEIKVYDRDTKEEKELIYAGASPKDVEAWYDDNEMPHKVNWVEVLIGKSK